MSYRIHTVPGKYYLIGKDNTVMPLKGTVIKYVPDGEDPHTSDYDEDYVVELTTTTSEDVYIHGSIFVDKAECYYGDSDDADGNQHQSYPYDCDSDTHTVFPHRPWD